MWRPEPFRRALLLLVGALLLVGPLSGCKGEDDEQEATPAPDPALVLTLAELHLADARAELTGASRDSLRAVALAAHGTSEAAIEAELDRLADSPEATDAVWSAVTSRLDAERLGTPLPEENAAPPDSGVQETR